MAASYSTYVNTVKEGYYETANFANNILTKNVAFNVMKKCKS